jgi:protein-cysteine N-palmitoyltransferase HHAT
MDILHYFGKLYSLNTLDTRFTVSSTTPPRDTTAESAAPAERNAKEIDRNLGRENSRSVQLKVQAQPSKWNTWEFYIYYVIFIVTVPQMFKAVVDVSRRT